MEIVGDEPIFETGLLAAGESGLGDLRRQLSRWTRAGKLLQLRRGLYALAPPFGKAKPHPFVIANRLVQGSYVSTQAALAFYGMIPETLAVTTSVTTGRPGQWITPLGRFRFRHVHSGLFFGYSRIDLGAGQYAFVATPEKALMDLVHLEPGADHHDFLRGLRLQRLDQFRKEELQRIADAAAKKKLHRAVAAVSELILEERDGYEDL